MTAPAAARVFACLADGQAWERPALARAAGLDPAELVGALSVLSSTGLRFVEADGRLALEGIDWLDTGWIRAALAPAVSAAVDIDLLNEAGSSNDVLLASPPPAVGRMSVCLVEFQHGGRGRENRVWNAPPGGTLCLSAAWQFGRDCPAPSALSLVVGVAVRRALAKCTGVDVGLKWPNDLVYRRAKLGGILVEARSTSGVTHVVAGVGLNVAIPADRLRQLSDWPAGATDLASAAAVAPKRNRLAAAVTASLFDAVSEFGHTGFGAFASEWNDAHVFAGEKAVLTTRESSLEGIVRGIDSDGALLFDHAGQIRRVLAGEISLRPAP